MIMVTLALSLAIWFKCWKPLCNDTRYLHVFAFAVLALGLMWLLRVEVRGIFALHPLFMMAMTMVFGVGVALWGGALALLFGAFLLPQSWSQLPVQCLLNVLVPVLTARGVLLFIESLPQRNLFVYMLGGGFCGAMVTMQAMAISSWLYVWLFGPEPLLISVEEYYYLSLLLMFPEGFINGALVTVLTVFRPGLVRTYNDQRYLGDR